jgi:hypothetical protein
MNFSSIPIVATAIAIVISWALFATVCSLMHEMIAQVIAERGKFMQKYLLAQLQDLPNGVNWANLLYQHGTIKLLSREPGKPTNDIEPKLFAETMVEVVGAASQVKANIAARAVAGGAGSLNSYKDPILNQFKAATRLLKPGDVLSFFDQAIVSAESKTEPNPDGTVNEAKIYLELVENIRKWYDEFTQRLTVWYKKKTRRRLFIIGLVLAIGLNVDSVQLFTYFNTSPDARSAILNYYNKNQEAMTAIAKRADTLKNTTLDSVYRMSGTLLRGVDSLQKTASLPIGFEYNIFNTLKSESGYGLFLKILGFILSGFAASLGGPFWYDLLKKIYTQKS